MHRLKVLTKLKSLEVVGILFFVFATLLITVILRSGESIYAYMELTDSWFKTFEFTINLLTHLPSFYGNLGTSIIVMLGFLLGLNIVLLVQHTLLQRYLTKEKPKISAIHSLTGLIATILGIGCAACGSAILYSLLSIIGATGLIFILPLHGSEFALIGLLLLGYSNWRLLGKLYNPYICDI